MQEIVVFWFRRDLRIEDNAGLYYALTDGSPVLPIFIFDTNILNQLTDSGDARVTFIHDQLIRLDARFRAAGSGLRVFKGDPLDIYKNLVESYRIKGVFTNRDYEPYATERDHRVEQFLKSHGIGFYTFKDHVVFERGEILNDQGEPYKVFTPFKNKWLSKLHGLTLQSFSSETHLQNLFRGEVLPVPELAFLGFSRTHIELPGGSVDLTTLKRYRNDRDFPALNGTTRLGIHLRFGTISIRKAVTLGVQNSDVWLSELIWREFYITILAFFPEVVTRSFKTGYDRIAWINDETHFDEWCKGNTGYPIVDAGMRELNATGYMHNRVRMIVASFLTKHLLIDWRWGESYFSQKLLDFELASNNGGWQWAAGTGTDAQPYFRVFNPTAQAEKFDPESKYIRKWVPEFQTPHYPKPIVDHRLARERAIKTYKEALS